jgi:dTDP-glucose pyrophosphorylase
MNSVDKHIIFQSGTVKDALLKLNELAADAILFLVDDEKRLIGSLTDGDLRRGFLRNLGFDDSLLKFIQPNPVSIRKGSYTLEQLEEYKKKNLRIIPIIDDERLLVDILNFRFQKTIIPADGVLMAGGKGKRLMPLTEHTPKPMLKINGKPIIEYNVDRLVKYGIKNIHLSINYLGEQLMEYFGNGEASNAQISYVRENKPLGTIGSILLIDEFEHDDILVMNSDLLTDIDYADFYMMFKDSGADMAVAATSYNLQVPYAVLEVDEKNHVTSLTEKPSFTYYSNAGIYFLKKSVLKLIPRDEFHDITDLMDVILLNNMKLVTYPITSYWLDIGKLDDFKKAQEDIKHIKLD